VTGSGNYRTGGHKERKWGDWANQPSPGSKLYIGSESGNWGTTKGGRINGRKKKSASEGIIWVANVKKICRARGARGKSKHQRHKERPRPTKKRKKSKKGGRYKKGVGEEKSEKKGRNTYVGKTIGQNHAVDAGSLNINTGNQRRKKKTKNLAGTKVEGKVGILLMNRDNSYCNKKKEMQQNQKLGGRIRLRQRNGQQKNTVGGKNGDRLVMNETP